MSEKSNNLIVIEESGIRTYHLDDRPEWTVGRRSGMAVPDICLSARAVSREHGRFHNEGGYWFYTDYNKKNGTWFRDGRHDGRIKSGLGGRFNPVIVRDRCRFVFGGGNGDEVSRLTALAIFSGEPVGDWRQLDTEDWTDLIFTDGVNTSRFNHPAVGTVAYSKTGMGIGIYMGDVTYLSGVMRLA